MNEATLFFQNLTCIDHATITPSGSIEGGSFHCSVSVTGKIEEVEQVVVDFSTLKKSIKELIDAKTEGFDHKLWVEKTDVNYLKGKKYAVISTPFFHSIVPSDAVKVINYDVGLEYEISLYLENQLDLLYPDSQLSCTIWLSTNKATSFLLSGEEDLALPFRYVHGLKNSTSYGCQNINHGHLSYMGLVSGDGQPIDLKEHREFRELSSTVFIWEENIINNKDDKLTIGYETHRGLFTATYDTKKHHCVISPKETTVENLASFLVEQYGELMYNLHGRQFYITEGLAKGSQINL